MALQARFFLPLSCAGEMHAPLTLASDSPAAMMSRHHRPALRADNPRAEARRAQSALSVAQAQSQDGALAQNSRSKPIRSTTHALPNAAKKCCNPRCCPPPGVARNQAQSSRTAARRRGVLRTQEGLASGGEEPGPARARRGTAVRMVHFLAQTPLLMKRGCKDEDCVVKIRKGASRPLYYFSRGAPRGRLLEW